MTRRILPAIACLLLLASTFASADEKPADDTAFNEERFVGYGLKAPAGLFKNVNDTTAGGVRVLNGTELFIDDLLIEAMDGTWQQLNQPVKHAANPVLVKTLPSEEDAPSYGTVHYDAQQNRFTMWYQSWQNTEGTSTGQLHYATSRDGIHWDKPQLDQKTGSNLVQHPAVQGFQCPGIMLDRRDPDPSRRYKMLYSCNPDGTAASWMTSAAFSPDGIHWTPSQELPLIPFSDTQVCPFWDPQRNRYVALLRFGPPNTRIISRTESEDFFHWSPKITVLRRTRMDAVQQTQFYQMAPMPYGNVYLGVIGSYHNESLKPIPADKPWTDRQDLQLAFSRDGVVWQRVTGQGAMTHAELNRDRDWKEATQQAVFLPYGKRDQTWDWGYITPYYTPDPIIIDDRIYFFYAGSSDKHWWTWKGDPPQLDPQAEPPVKGVGLATLRVDGFVSVNSGPTGGTLTTTAFLFLGDTLLLNADAEGGEILVEVLDDQGKTLPGFGTEDFVALTTDSVRHSLIWKGQPDLHQLQGRPLQIRFHLRSARLFSITPRTMQRHYVPAYD